MMSTAIPVLLVAAGIWGSFYFAGLYGVAIAAVGMLSNLGIQLAVDAYVSMATLWQNYPIPSDLIDFPPASDSSVCE